MTIPLLTARTGPNQDLYARALASVYRSGYRLHDVDYALQRDADPLRKALLNPKIRQAYDIRLNGVATELWQVMPPPGASDQEKKLAQICEEALQEIGGFQEARKEVASAVITGRSYAFIGGERRRISLGGLDPLPWWVPTRLTDIDYRRFRWVPVETYDDTGRRRIRSQLELFSISREQWEPVTRPELFVKCVFNDQESRLGYGRSLLEAIYVYLWMHGEALQHGLDGLSKWARGIITVGIDGLRSGDQTNTELQDSWLEAIDAVNTQHGLAHDIRDVVSVHQGGAEGHQVVMDFLRYLDDGMSALLLGSVLPFGGGQGTGSLARARSEEDTHADLIVFDRGKVDETLTRDVLGLFKWANRHLLREVGLHNARRGKFKSVIEQRTEPEKAATVAATLMGAGVPLVAHEVYEKTGYSVPSGNEPVLRGLAAQQMANDQARVERESQAAEQAAQKATAGAPGVESAAGINVAMPGAEPPTMQELSLAYERAIKNRDRATANLTRRRLWAVMGFDEISPDLSDEEWQEMTSAGNPAPGGPGGQPPFGGGGGDPDDEPPGDGPDDGPGGGQPPKPPAKFGADWKDGDHPRGDDGRFVSPDGDDDAGEVEDLEFTEPGELATPAPGNKSKIAAVAKGAWAVLNAGPKMAEAVVKETGVSDRVAKISMWVAMVGDYAVPGIPAGSVAVTGIATIATGGRAPVRAAKKAIENVREKLAEARHRKGKTGGAASVETRRSAGRMVAGVGGGGPGRDGGRLGSGDGLGGSSYRGNAETAQGGRLGNGRWVTIGAQDVTDSKGRTKGEGGTPVYIEDGKITKGPAGMVGNTPDDPRGKRAPKAPAGPHQSARSRIQAAIESGDKEALREISRQVRKDRDKLPYWGDDGKPSTERAALDAVAKEATAGMREIDKRAPKQPKAPKAKKTPADIAAEISAAAKVDNTKALNKLLRLKKKPGRGSLSTSLKHEELDAIAAELGIRADAMDARYGVSEGDKAAAIARIARVKTGAIGVADAIDRKSWGIDMPQHQNQAVNEACASAMAAEVLDRLPGELNGEIQSDDSTVKFHLAAMYAMPDAHLALVARMGNKIYLAPKGLPQQDHLADIVGTKKASGGEWSADDGGGVFAWDRQSIVVRSDRAGGNTMPHELGHSIDHGGGGGNFMAERDSEFRALADEAHESLSEYVKSYKTKQVNAPENYYKEAFADLYGDMIYLGEKKASAKYGNRLVAKIKGMIENAIGAAQKS